MVKEILNHITKSKTQYHAVLNIRDILLKHQFIELDEKENYNLESGKAYFVIRNDASIMAFKMPKEVTKFKIVASHLDSPNFKLKPNPLYKQGGYDLLNTESYGGAIYSSWLDRSLGVGGRVIINHEGKVLSKVVTLDNYTVIPNLCIHFNRDINNGYVYHLQSDMQPFYSQEDGNVLKDVAKALKIKEKDILSFDLSVYNMDSATLFGPNKEFFTSPRIDNLECAYTTLYGFLNSDNSDDTCNIYISYNHEEVGSMSREGAFSTFLLDNLNRILKHTKGEKEAVFARSMMISADNGHAVHYAHLGKTDPTNKVFMNKGIIIKSDSKNAYSSDGYSRALIQKIWNENNIKYQMFSNHSDIRGGGTLGVISLTQVSIPCVDIGLAQLAMHSSCETAGVKDIDEMINGIKVFFNAK